jgi:hypothetical protein
VSTLSPTTKIFPVIVFDCIVSPVTFGRQQLGLSQFLIADR